MRKTLALIAITLLILLLVAAPVSAQVAITGLPSLSETPDAADVIPLVDTSVGTTKKVTYANLINGLLTSAAINSESELEAIVGIDFLKSGDSITAAAGDSATAFFSAGTIENARLDASVSLLGQTIAAAELASADFGDFTCNGTTCSFDAGTVSANELDEAGVEAGLEAVLDLADLQGAVTDAQVPNNITIDLAATASALTGFTFNFSGVADGNCAVYDGVTDNRWEPGSCGSGGSFDEAGNYDPTGAWDFSGGSVILPSGVSIGGGTTPFGIAGFTDDVAPGAPATANQFNFYWLRADGMPYYHLESEGSPREILTVQSQHAGTDVKADLEEEAHATEHAENAGDELLVENLGTACAVGELAVSDGSGGLDCAEAPTGGGGGSGVTANGVLMLSLDGAGAAIATGVAKTITIAEAITITEARIYTEGAACSIVLDIWADTTAALAAGTLVDADSITASAPVTLSSDVYISDSTLTGWDTTIAAGSALRFNVDSADCLTASVQILYTKDAVAPTGSVTMTIDGNGVEITTGNKRYVRVPYAGTITQVTTLAAESCAVVVDVWNDTYANYPPTDADSITASAPPTLSGPATKAQDATLTGWDTAVAAGDILGFNVDSVSGCTWVTVQLDLDKS